MRLLRILRKGEDRATAERELHRRAEDLGVPKDDCRIEAGGNQDPIAIIERHSAEADLMLMGFRLKESIEGAMANAANSLEQFGKLMPAIKAYLKISRQIDRLAQIENRGSAARGWRMHPAVFVPSADRQRRA